MKKILALFAMALVATLVLQSCGVTDTQNAVTSSDRATVRTHFFPQDNGMVYTYSRYTNNKYDTVACDLVIGQNRDAKNSLVYSNAGTNAVLYYFSYTTDQYGNIAAELANDSSQLLALDGELVPGATWIADAVHGIRATVMEHYDEYYLPGRTAHFNDVVAVKYHADGKPDNVYTLRFFARGEGLVFERLVDDNSEISSLQIINIQYPTNHNSLDRKEHHFPQSMIWMPPPPELLK